MTTLLLQWKQELNCCYYYYKIIFALKWDKNCRAKGRHVDCYIDMLHPLSTKEREIKFSFYWTSFFKNRTFKFGITDIRLKSACLESRYLTCIDTNNVQKILCIRWATVLFRQLSNYKITKRIAIKKLTVNSIVFTFLIVVT